MTTLNDQQLARLAYDAGFRGDALRWAVAIAKAESGGNPSAYNPEIAAGTVPGSGSRGLWQIYGTAHPQYNSSLAFDPSTNAKAAYQVYSEVGHKFTPWSTYTNGQAAQYYQQLGGLKVGNDSGGGSASSGSDHPVSGREGHTGTGPGYDNSIVGAADQLSQTTTAINKIASGEFITEAWSKVDKVSLGFYIAGIVLILIGLLVLFAKPAEQLIVNTSTTAAKAAVIAA